MKLADAGALRSTPLRDAAVDIVEAGLQAIDTEGAIRRRVRVDGGDLLIDDTRFPLPHGRLLLVGAGKCSADAVRTLAAILGEKVSAGLAIDIVVRPAEGVCDMVTGDHPYPSARNAAHTARLLSMLSGLSPEDGVIFVVSGGGTVLLAQPPEGFSVEEEAALIKTLFRGGADIHRMNTVRKHLSRARGGFLAAAAYPARSVSLIFSDVPGNDVSFISSGPTVKDGTTLEDAREVLARFGGSGPEVARASAALLETPQDDKYFAAAQHVLFMSNRVALSAMAEQARSKGFEPTIVTDDLSGLADDIGQRIAGDIAGAKPGSCLLYGGETTVRIRGFGIGGRNRQVALAALPMLPPSCLVAAVASDGIDNGPQAGAFADGLVADAAKKKSLDVWTYLRNNDSQTFFEQTGGAMRSGPTGSNVADLMFALKAPS